MTSVGSGGKGAGAPDGRRAGNRALTGGSFSLWLGGLLVLHLVLGALHWEPVLFTGGDNVVYMILGKALASGTGYVDLHLPGAPLHSKYPPVYPALLAVADLFGGLQVSKALSLLLTTGAVGLTGLLGRRLFRSAIGIGAAAVMAVNPVLLQYSHWVLSEAPFTFLVLASLWAWERREDELDAAHGSATWGWLPLALAAAAFLTRTAGLPLLVIAVAVPALRHRWKEAGLAAVAATAAAGGWAAYQAIAAPAEAGYVGELLMVNPYDPSAGTVGVADLLARAASNSWLYVSTILPLSFLEEPGTGTPSAGLLLNVTGLVILALAAVGWARRAVSRLGAPELFAVLYAGLIVLWPSVWSNERFLLPLLPLLTIYVLAAGESAVTASTDHALDLLRKARSRPAVIAVSGLAIIAGLVDAGRRVPDRIDCLAGWRQDSPCTSAALQAFFELARWTGGHTPPDAIVANRKPAFFWWFSRRQGDVYPFSENEQVVLDGLERMGADYAVSDVLSVTTGAYLDPVIVNHPERFEFVHSTGPPDTYLFRFRSEPRTALGEAR